MDIKDSITATIGNTPLVRLNSVTDDLACTILAKVEFFNPGGSVKDRIGPDIIADAEQSGRLKPGGTIVEATSGNTGVGLAIGAALKGYRCIFVMPDKMSQEKILLLRAFGARVVVTPTAVEPDDPRSYYSVAHRLVKETPNAVLANQYHNPENPRSHYQTTGPEIWNQTRISGSSGLTQQAQSCWRPGSRAGRRKMRLQNRIKSKALGKISCRPRWICR